MHQTTIATAKVYVRALGLESLYVKQRNRFTLFYVCKLTHLFFFALAIVSLAIIAPLNSSE